MQPAELATGGRFAGALQAAHHKHRRAGLQMQRMVHRAHQLDEFAMNDADHLHVGIDRLQDPFADGFLGHVGDEILHDRIADVGFEQSPFDELHAIAHVRFGEFSLAAQRFDGALRPSSRASNMGIGSGQKRVE